MDPVELNWLAIVVATIVVFAGGALWYSPLLFSEEWVRLTGMTEERIREGFTPAVALTAQAILTVIAIVTLAVIVSWAGADTLVEGVMVGGIVALGIMVADSLKLVFFENRTLKLSAINNGYNVLAFLIAGGILGAWR